MRVLWKSEGESQILLKVVNGTWLECLHFLSDLNKTGYQTYAQIFVSWLWICCSMHFFFFFMYCLLCDVPCIVCMYMCTEQLPPGGYPVAVKYIISHIISYHIISYHIISYHIISYHIISYIIYQLLLSNISVGTVHIYCCFASLRCNTFAHDAAECMWDPCGAALICTGWCNVTLSC
jgi:hypothetical protein